jgi:hypothetical protein
MYKYFQRDATVSWFLFQELNSTCFGRSPRPSSGVTLLQMQALVKHMSAGL